MPPRKTVQQRDPNQDTRGAMRSHPECQWCGFDDWGNDAVAPYKFCDGDPTRHLRQPVSAS